MARKIKEIAVAPQPKATRLGVKAAGALLFGTLSFSCAPETIQLSAKSPITIAAVQPKPQESDPRWVQLSEKYLLTDKEKAILEMAFLLEKEKTAFWPSNVFESLLENRSLRENHLENCSRLIDSTLKRADSMYAKNVLGSLGEMFESKKVGGAELDIMLNLVEGGPELGPKHLLTMHNTASMFRSEAYSPEFLGQMLLFFNNGGVMGNYVTREEKMLVLNAFHALSKKGNDHTNTFNEVSELLKIYSERSDLFRKESTERFERWLEQIVAPPGGIAHNYSGPSEHCAAIAILNAFLNPNLDQQMFDDLIFELKTIIYSDYTDSSISRSALKCLGELYSLDFFDSVASSGLRAHIKKSYPPSFSLGEFLESALLVSKGRNFRSPHHSHLFVNVLDELKQIALTPDLELSLSASKKHPIGLSNIVYMLGANTRPKGSFFLLFSLLAEQGLLVEEASFQIKFEQAKHVAKEVGANYTNPEVCLNFAYAIEVMGKDKTSLLHIRYGIEYFRRYPKELLEELPLSQESDYRDSSPIAFVIYNKNDHNGAFYTHSNVFAHLLKTHKLFITEVDSDREIPKKMEDILSNQIAWFGRRGISLLLIGGHGSPDGISLGSHATGGSELTSSDMRMFRRIREHFVSNPTVVLVSCSTGENERAMGGKISEALGAQLFAPKEDGNLHSIQVGPDGKILDVTYTVDRNEFESGKIKREEGEE